MSKAGRLQDALWDILYEHPAGGYTTEMVKGPCSHLSLEEWSTLLDNLVDTAFDILLPPDEGSNG